MTTGVTDWTWSEGPEISDDTGNNDNDGDDDSTDDGAAALTGYATALAATIYAFAF